MKSPRITVTFGERRRQIFRADCASLPPSAAKGIRSAIEERSPVDLSGLVTVVANQFGAVGGAMGALSYVLVDAVGKAASTDGAPFSAAQLARLLRAAEDAVTGFGGAKRGDKTIVDAIAPAREAAEECASPQRPANKG